MPDGITEMAKELRAKKDSYKASQRYLCRLRGEMGGAHVRPKVLPRTGNIFEEDSKISRWQGACEQNCCRMETEI